MRDKDEILNDRRILKVYKNIENDKIMKLKLEIRSIKGSDKALVCFSRVLGWEHLSVSFKNKIPSWEVMNEFKEMFWKDDEDAFQYHPIKDNYINNNEYTLHIWRPLETSIPVPPSITVGIRMNHLEEDKQAIRDLQEYVGSPISEEELELMILTCTQEGRKHLDKAISKMSINDLAKLSAKFGGM